MSTVFPIHNNFTSGIISELLHARGDLRAYNNGLKQCMNAVVLPHGGVTNRGGFKYVANTKSDGAAVLIPFIFNNTPENSYILEFGNQYIRFYKSFAQLEDTGSPYEIVSPYQAADLFNIRYAQSADVMYLVDGNHTPRKLIRSGDTDWTIEEHPFAGTPFGPPNEVKYSVYTFENYFEQLSEALFEVYFNSSHGLTTQLEEGNFPIDTTWGISYGIDGDPPAQPDFLEDIRAGTGIAPTSGVFGDLSAGRLSIELQGTLFIPKQSKYYFALNAEEAYTFAFGEKNFILFSSFKTSGSATIASSNGDRDQFANKVHGISTTRNKKYQDIDGNDITLNIGKQNFWMRIAEDDNAIPGKFTIAWRDGGDVSFSGSGSSSFMALPYLGLTPEDSTKDWYGSRCLQIRIWIDPSDNTKWGWAYREETDIDTYTAWTPIIGNIAADGAPQTGDTDPISGLGQPYNSGPSDYGLQDETGSSPNGTFLDELMATFTFSGATGTAGDYWTFKVGFIPIKGVHFQKETESTTVANPRSVTIHENRLVYAGSDNEPATFWGSRSGNFDDFTLQSSPTKDGPYKYTVSSDSIDRIQWIKSVRQLVIGTLGNEHVVYGADGFINPVDPPEIRGDTFYGSEFVDPIIAGNTILFSEKDGVRVREYAYRFEIDGYRGSDATIQSYALLANGVKQMAYQKAAFPSLLYSEDQGASLSLTMPPVSIIWLVTDQSDLKGLTYERQHEVLAWHEHQIDEGSVDIESVAVIPGTRGDEVYIVAKDGSERYVCYLDQETTKDLTGGTTEYPWQAIVETLPLELEAGNGQTSRGMVKSWNQLFVTQFGSEDLTISRGSVDFNTYRQTVADNISNAPQDKQVYLFGYDKQDASLIFKSALTISQQSKPMTVLALHGKVEVNAP